MYLNRYLPMIKTYNNGDGLLTFISEDIGNLFLVLEYMGQKDDYFIDSAAPMNVSGEKLLLTTTSIILLYKYNMLDKLQEHYDIYILSGLVNKMKKEEKLLLEEIKKEGLKERFSLNNTEDDGYYEILNEKLQHINNIQELVSKFKIIDIYDDMKKNVISSIIPSYDVAAAEFARKNKMQLVVDDAATIGLFETFIGVENITNTSGIICKYLMLDNFYESLESLKLLISDRYLFALDFQILCFIIDRCINDNRRDELKEILRLLLEKDYDKQYYRLLNAYIEVSPKIKYIECEIIKEIIEEFEKNKDKDKDIK